MFPEKKFEENLHHTIQQLLNLSHAISDSLHVLSEKTSAVADSFLISSGGTLRRRNRSNHQIQYELITSEYVGKQRKRKMTVLGGPDDETVRAMLKQRILAETQQRIVYNLELLNALQRHWRSLDYETILASLPDAFHHPEDFAEPAPSSESISMKRSAGSEFNMKSHPPKNTMQLPKSFCIAADGTKCRSKSEAAIINLLISYGIPFAYDARVRVVDEHGDTIHRYADFMIFLPDGTVIIWEHYGVLNDEDYLNRAVTKTMEYFRSGYLLNRNLIITTDLPGGGIDTQMVDQVIRGLILPRFQQDESIPDDTSVFSFC